jgi:hypothetical protein
MKINIDLLFIIQNNVAYDAGYRIGYVVGRIFPILILLAIVFFVFHIYRKKSKK